MSVHGEADVVVAKGDTASIKENEGPTMAVILTEFPGGAGEGVGLEDEKGWRVEQVWQ